MKMASDRIVSIDIMRGLTLLLMLFVNDLNMDVAPAWIGHMEADFDGMGLADWVFPGFLFIMGMAIPFAFARRIEQGMAVQDISRHVLYRSLSLIVIGVLMLNAGRVNPDLTGMSKNLWALLMYGAVFLIWNDYQKNDKSPFLVMGLRLLGIGILIMLVLKFRSGQEENDGSLIAGWWGILGLLGWGYMAASLVYLFFRDSIIKTIAAACFFLTLNILWASDLLEFLNPVKPFLGILIQGNVPLIVLTGLIAGLILRENAGNGHRKIILTLAAFGAASLLAGFILKNWFILSKIQATPSWGLVCSGISFFVFVLIYIITDVFGKSSWAAFFRPAGENSLTTYLAPDILYYLIWMTGFPVLVYKDSMNPWIVVGGSFVWAIAMVWLTALLKRIGISLKL
jgi:predicted acyltransferase